MGRGETFYQEESQALWILNLTKFKGSYYLGMRWVEPSALHLLGKCCTTELYTSSKDASSPSCVVFTWPLGFIPTRED